MKQLATNIHHKFTTIFSSVIHLDESLISYTWFLLSTEDTVIQWQQCPICIQDLVSYTMFTNGLLLSKGGKSCSVDHMTAYTVTWPYLSHMTDGTVFPEHSKKVYLQGCFQLSLPERI